MPFAHAAGVGSSCCVFMFCVFAAASPYWIWTFGGSEPAEFSNGTLKASDNGGGRFGGTWSSASPWGSAMLSSGIYTAASTSVHISCTSWYYCYSTDQTYWEGEEHVDSACDPTACGKVTGAKVPETCPDGSPMTAANCLTQMLEKFEMCVDGKFKAPSALLKTKYLTIVACAFAAMAITCAIFSRHSKMALCFASLASCAVAALTCAAFVYYTSWDYQSEVRRGSAGLMMRSAKPGCRFTQSGSSEFSYGAAYGVAITAFVVSLLNAVMFLCLTTRSGGQESDGDYGSGGSKYV